MNMKIINFKANLISQGTVQKRNENKYRPKQVSFVEFSASDLDTIAKVKEDWKYSFASDIYNNFVYKYNNKAHLYGMVDQQTDYEEIKPENVLGLAYVQELINDTTDIEYLQVNPKYIHDNNDDDHLPAQKPTRKREYKETGTAILDAIKAKYCNHLIQVVPSMTAEQFYLENGFEFDDEYKLQMHWKNKKNTNKASEAKSETKISEA